MQLLNFHCVLLIVLVISCYFSNCNALANGAKPPRTITINKCCRIGSQLATQTRECLIGSTEKWFPRVFQIQKNSFYKPLGEAPRFIQTAEATIPSTCDNPDLMTDIAILSTGGLFLTHLQKTIENRDDFCVDKDVALVCLHLPPTPETLNAGNVDPLIQPKTTPKIRKCCGPNFVYNKINSECVSLAEGHPILTRNVINSSRVDMIYGFPKCDINSSEYTLVGQFHLRDLDESTGKLKIHESTAIIDSENGNSAPKIERLFDTTDYCLDHTVLDLEYSDVSVFTCVEHFASHPQSIPVNHRDLRYLVYGIGLLISVIFLSATLATGFLLPSNHHVLHWRCQTYYVACLLVGDLLLAITQIAGNGIAGKSCAITASFMHFFFLAAFFWLNTMCFNIWWTFRDFRPTSLEKSQEMLRLHIYQVYAWGVPLVISVVAAILDNLPKTPDETFLRPRFGERTCWFYGDLEILTYFFGPIGILLIINFLLFASTARQLTCGLWKRDDVKSTTERSMKSLLSRAALGRVCLKLIVVMGVTWMADVISWAVGGPHYFWYLTDLINALQGVLIFIVVGCQPQVWAAVKRIWSSKAGRDVMNTTHGAQHSSSSHGLPSIGESVTNNTNTTSSKIPMETIC